MREGFYYRINADILTRISILESEMSRLDVL